MPARVDTDVHPHATGPAADLVSAHKEDHPLQLYAGWFCPYVQRAWLVLEEKHIPYQYVEINPYRKDPEFLALNPLGLVPTLAVPLKSEGRQLRPLYESTVICEYLDEAFAAVENGPSLLPADPYERARCRLWIDHISKRIVPGFYRLLQHQPTRDYSIEEARRGFHGHILSFVKEMESDGPWFLGKTFSLVDIMLAPWAMRLWLIDHYKPGGMGIPQKGQGGEDERTWSRWRTWYEAISTRDSVVHTLSEPEYYIRDYRRYAEDTTNSEVAQATRQGRALP